MMDIFSDCEKEEFLVVRNRLALARQCFIDAREILYALDRVVSISDEKADKWSVQVCDYADEICDIDTMIEENNLFLLVSGTFGEAIEESYDVQSVFADLAVKKLFDALDADGIKGKAFRELFSLHETLVRCALNTILSLVCVPEQEDDGAYPTFEFYPFEAERIVDDEGHRKDKIKEPVRVRRHRNTSHVPVSGYSRVSSEMIQDTLLSAAISVSAYGEAEAYYEKYGMECRYRYSPERF